MGPFTDEKGDRARPPEERLPGPAAAGLMTLQELGAKLEELEEGSKEIERESTALKAHRQRVEELEKDRDTFLQSMSEMVPDTLNDLFGEEKNRL